MASPLDIAIVGKAGLFPSSPSLDIFWKHILSADDCSREVPPGRWILDPKAIRARDIAEPDRVASNRACLLDEVPACVFRALGEDESQQLDPLFHLIAHVGRAAARDAKLDVDPSRVGVMVANIALPTAGSSKLSREIYRAILTARSERRRLKAEQCCSSASARNMWVTALPAVLFAEDAGYGGPVTTLDAACASSLYAIQMACRELRRGRVDAVLAGGVSRPDCLYTQMGFSQLRSLSPSGHCYPFDERADGLVVGEGAGIFVLKRLEDALTARDRIDGVIRAVGVSNDRGGKLLAPDSEGQLRAMRAAYEQAQWMPTDVELIECHGTGTPTGDAVEFASLMTLRGDSAGSAVIGSVKSNVGHLLTGAGAAGLMKVMLSFRDKTLPPQANFSRPSETIPYSGSSLRILNQPEPWESPTPRRAAVSAFGFGGINAHLLLEEWQGTTREWVPVTRPTERVAVVGLSTCVGESVEIPSLRGRGACEVMEFPKGHYLTEIALGSSAFRIPPNEIKQLLPQQVLMLKVAKEAFEDSGEVKVDRNRCAVVIGIELDPNACNFDTRWSLLGEGKPEEAEAASPALNASRTLGALGGMIASRIAREFDFGGPSFVCSAANPGSRALETAISMLESGDADQILVGQVELGGDYRTVIAGRPSPRDGACALLLKRLSDANRDGDSVYACIEGTGGGLFEVCTAIRNVSEQTLDGQPWVRNRMDGPRTLNVQDFIITEHASDRLPAFRFPEATCFPPVSGSNPGKIAFVYPGSGNFFTGMGKEFASRFPKCIDRLDRESARLKDQLAWTVLDSEREPTNLSTILGQVSFGLLTTEIVREFGVKPDAMIGYSLGESAGCVALRAWPDRDSMWERFVGSPLFREDLTGPCLAARAHYGITRTEPFQWKTVVVSASAETIRKKISDQGPVFLLIVNVEGECVIGGPEEAIETVLREMGAPWFPVSGVTTVHCAIARQVERAYFDLHFQRTQAVEGVLFYSGAWERSYEMNSENAARAITDNAIRGFDFWRVVEQAYRDGVRIFLEMGPHHSCTRLISRILEGKPHVAVSVSSRGQSEWETLMRAMRELSAAGVPVKVPDGKQRVENAVSEIRLPIELPAPELQRTVAAIPTQNPFVQLSLSTARAHEAFLKYSQAAEEALAAGVKLQANFRDMRRVSLYDREACLEFARGKISRVLGDDFSEADTFPTRVRLPDEPLMLVDRILEVRGQPKSLTSGSCITEHDIRPGDWYLECGRMPVSITVESGQADLFLSGYLGIDFATQGLRRYRLLDAEITFHRKLPCVGEVMRYEIAIDRFVQQGDTYLFFFRFDGFSGRELVLTMRDGSAGFFSNAQLEAGQGVVLKAEETLPSPGKLAVDLTGLPQMQERMAFSDQQMQSLREGHLATAFGPAFSAIQNPHTLPSGRMKLIDRVLELDPKGGRFGLGRITAEADVHPDDWYLTCHFVDDEVMPGTLMYECCLHTLRVFLLRMGWVGEKDQVSYEPIPMVPSRLRCRGQVLASTRKVTYQIDIKELGYGPEPYAIAEALMSADGKRIVLMSNMSVRLMGLTQEKVEKLWKKRSRVPVFDTDRILAFAVGKPSDAFGDRYRIFDDDRRIARLPGPPYQFLDRITDVSRATAWKLEVGSEIEAQYDVPPNAWYFSANHQRSMAFSILLEIALQPCGWLSAYLGSALCSESDLSFRNLGGRAIQRVEVFPESGTLTTTVKLTRFSEAGGMLIQNYDLRVVSGKGLVYSGETSFGFFSKEALSQQIGVRGSAERRFIPSQPGRVLSNPDVAPFSPQEAMRMPFREAGLCLPGRAYRMIDDISLHDDTLIGRVQVTPDAWFFRAHFYQDPVWPGSLGLESFLQLLKAYARDRYPNLTASHRFEPIVLGRAHTWLYRGQVIPTNREVSVEARITRVEEGDAILIQANGFLVVDGLVIYEMTDFGIRLVPMESS